MKEFKTKETAIKLDLEVSTVDYYVKAGVIKPKEPGKGRGSFRLFSESNLAEIKLARFLSKALTVEQLKNFFDYLRDMDRADEHLAAGMGKKGEAIFDPRKEVPNNITLVLNMFWENDILTNVNITAVDEKRPDPQVLKLSNIKTMILVNLTWLMGTI